MKKLLGKLFVASLLVSLSSSAIYAQNDGERGNRGERGGPGGPGGRQGFFGGGMGGGGISSIISIPEVATELKLDDSQKEELQTARRAQEEEVRKLLGGGQGGPGGGRPGAGGPGGMSEENRAKLDELRSKLDEKLSDILDPDQFKRLLGIYAQTDTVRALSNPLIAKEVGVSEAQIADIKKVQEESGAKIRELMGSGFDFRSEDSRAKIQAARQETSDKALAVLSSEQKTKFEELKGAKFDLPQGGGFGGRGQGGPGGQGRGDRGPRGQRGN